MLVRSLRRRYRLGLYLNSSRFRTVLSQYGGHLRSDDEVNVSRIDIDNTKLRECF